MLTWNEPSLRLNNVWVGLKDQTLVDEAIITEHSRDHNETNYWQSFL